MRHTLLLFEAQERRRGIRRTAASRRRYGVGQFRHPRGAMGQVAGWVMSRYETVTRAALILGTMAAIGIPCAFAQERFEWEGMIAAGKAIEIKGINGKVEASAASGNQVQVVATKSSRLSDVSSVRIETIEHANGVTVCAVYPSDQPNECTPGAEEGRINRDNDVVVDFMVRVPAGVRFIERTVYGNVEANSIDGDVEAYTFSGQVEVSATGLVQAQTFSGSIEVSTGRSDWEDDLTFATFSGDITIEIPYNTSADVRAVTFNGEISSDFPMTVSGGFFSRSRRLNGTIGNGGRGLRLTTFSGSIRLRRSITGSRSYFVPDRGGVSVSSQGTSANTIVGYGRVRPDAGSTTPSGLAIFASTQGGVLVAEASVPASRPISEGRIVAEVNGPVTTGLAMANPNNQDATITFFFTDRTGTDFAHGSFILGANRQTASFLDQDPFNSGPSVLGTFTFASSVPVAVIALRGLTNERDEFLITTLPVSPLTTASEDTIYFPHFADGGGWTTEVILVNPTDTTISGNVQFLGTGSETTSASPATLMLTDAQAGTTFAYSIPPRSSRRLQTSNPAGSTQVGSVRVVRNARSSSASGLGIFSFAEDGVTVTEAGVPVQAHGSSFRLYVEASGTPGQIGSIRSGVAITNTSSAATTAICELTDLDGTSTGQTGSLLVPGSGQVAKFIDEIFPSLPTPFSGVLRVTSTSTNIAIVGLRGRTNERADLLIATTPPAEEGGTTVSSDTYFPHIADSGGWATQVILFSGTAGQTSTGTLQFINQNGQALDLPVSSTFLTASGFDVHFIDAGKGDAAIVDVGQSEIIIDGGDSTRVLHDYVEQKGIIDGLDRTDCGRTRGCRSLAGTPEAFGFRHAGYKPGYNRDCNALTNYDQFISRDDAGTISPWQARPRISG